MSRFLRRMDPCVKIMTTYSTGAWWVNTLCSLTFRSKMMCGYLCNREISCQAFKISNSNCHIGTIQPSRSESFSGFLKDNTNNHSIDKMHPSTSIGYEND